MVNGHKISQAQNNLEGVQFEVRCIQTTRGVGEYTKICLIDSIN